MNKKVFAIALLLINISMLSINAEAVSIKELKNNLIDYWKIERQSYGRMISINTPIFVPEVESLPILRVKLFSLSKDAISKLGYVDGNRNSVVSQGFYRLPSSTIIGRQYDSIVFQNIWQNNKEFDFNSIYALNQIDSLESMIAEYREAFAKLYSDAAITIIPYKARVKTPYYNVKAGTYEYRDIAEMGELTGIGDYSIHYWPALRGIPVFMGCNIIYNSRNTTKVQTRLTIKSRMSVEQCMSDDVWAINSIGVWHEIGLYANDYELCNFDEVLNSLTQLIDDGRIRNIYSIALGYVIYANPEVTYDNKSQEETDTQEYLAIPTWVVETSYVENGQIEYSSNPVRDDPSAYDYSAHDPKYTVLHISAQTGKVYDINDTSVNRVYSKDNL